MKHSVTVKRCGSNYIVTKLTNRVVPSVGGVIYHDELKALVEAAKEDPTLTVIVTAK